MQYGQLGVFSLMKQQMQYLGARQSIIAQNIANADTPGYVPQDLERPDFSRQLQIASGNTGLTRTHPGHMSGNGAGSGNFNVVELSSSFETNPNSNQVSIEQEIQKLSLNQAEYQRITSLYSKTTDMFRTAIGRPGA